MLYTIEVYKSDKRTKKGEVLVRKVDVNNCDRLTPEQIVKAYKFEYPRHRIEIHETFITRTNAMTGKEFQERYDTPWSCSPASETYWSS